MFLYSIVSFSDLPLGTSSVGPISTPAIFPTAAEPTTGDTDREGAKNNSEDTVLSMEVIIAAVAVGILLLCTLLVAALIVVCACRRSRRSKRSKGHEGQNGVKIELVYQTTPSTTIASTVYDDSQSNTTSSLDLKKSTIGSKNGVSNPLYEGE